MKNYNKEILKQEIGNRSISLCLTNECNTMCRYCSCVPKGIGKGKELPYEYIENILTTLSKNKAGFQTLQFTGGEPLLHSRFFDILQLARRLGFILRLQTNGLLLEDLEINQKKLLKDVAIKVSLDGTSAIYHEKFRQKGSFLRVIAGIESSIESGLSVGVRTVFTKYNIEIANDFIPFLNELGVSAWSYNSIRPVGHAKTMGDKADLISEYDIHRKIIPHFYNKKYIHLLNGTNILRHILANSRRVKDKQPWLLWWNGDIYEGPAAQFEGASAIVNIINSDDWQLKLNKLHPGYRYITMDQRSYYLISKLRSSLHNNFWR